MNLCKHKKTNTSIFKIVSELFDTLICFLFLIWSRKKKILISKRKRETNTHIIFFLSRHPGLISTRIKIEFFSLTTIYKNNKKLRFAWKDDIFCKVCYIFSCYITTFSMVLCSVGTVLISKIDFFPKNLKKWIRLLSLNICILLWVHFLVSFL